MPQTTITRTYDTVATLAAASIIENRLFDQVIDSSPFLTWVMGKDMPQVEQYQKPALMPDNVVEEMTALYPTNGTRIELRLENAQNSLVRWITPWEYITPENQELATLAVFYWKDLGGVVVLNDIEQGRMDGKEHGQKMVKVQTNSLKKAMIANLQQTVFEDGSRDDGKASLGLQAIVSSTPTTGTLGTINRATAGNEYWRNQQVAQSAALTSEAKMTQLYHKCSINNSQDTPTFIVCKSNPYEQIETITRSRERLVQNKQMAQLGFTHFLFKGKSVVTWDNNCPAGNMYMLSKKGIKVAVNPRLNIKMSPWQRQGFVTYSHVVLEMQMIPVEPRLLGVLTAITDA